MIHGRRPPPAVRAPVPVTHQHPPPRPRRPSSKRHPYVPTEPDHQRYGHLDRRRPHPQPGVRLLDDRLVLEHEHHRAPQRHRRQRLEARIEHQRLAHPAHLPANSRPSGGNATTVPGDGPRGQRNIRRREGVRGMNGRKARGARTTGETGKRRGKENAPGPFPRETRDPERLAAGADIRHGAAFRQTADASENAPHRPRHCGTRCPTTVETRDIFSRRPRPTVRSRTSGRNAFSARTGLSRPPEPRTRRSVRPGPACGTAD